MIRIDLDRKFIDKVMKNKEYHIQNNKEVYEKLKNSTGMYKGKPVPYLYMPKVYTKVDIDRFNKLSGIMMGILTKVIDKYVEDKEYRKEFGFEPLLENLIVKEHGYNSYVPMARIDIFYNDNGDFKFCELNADGSSAMNEDRELARIFKETNVLNHIGEEITFDSFELFESWVDECLNMYREFKGELKDNINLVITDLLEQASSEEFEVFRDTFKRRGINAIIADTRELKYREGKLFFNDTEVDIVYRRAVTKQILDYKDEVSDFINACLDGNVCVIGPIKSQVIHNKRIFKVLHDEKTKEFLTDDEKRFVENHIPMTKYFEGEGWDFEEIVKNKEGYILKPSDLYASKGVYAGKDFTDEEWREKIKECFGKDYLIQEYCNPYETELIEVDGDDIKTAMYKNITGLYMYNEKMYGIYSRVGKNSIIADAHVCYTLPSFIVEEK